MRRFTLLLSLIFSISFFSRAQENIFVLHPILGDTIDAVEKTDYLLFPEINDSIFNYCIIKNRIGWFNVCVYLKEDSIITFQLDSSEINQYKVNIDKLYDYYSNLTTGDSLKDLKILIYKEGKSFQIIDIAIDSEKLSNEMRSIERWNEDAERLKLQQQGADLGGIYIEVDHIRNKKKK